MKTSMELPLTQRIRPHGRPHTLKEYEKAQGYRAIRKALLGMSPPEVVTLVKDAGLLGRGGGGFPAGVKWSGVPMGPDSPRPKYLVVNADEMEPGTFKDRILLEGDPHQMIESIIVSAFAIEADVAYIFLRWAYKLAAKRLAEAIAEAYKNNYLGRNILGSGFSLDVRVHTSVGRYMCGEAMALINALEGRRAVPRATPPHATECGLWGRPTVVNNVETLCNVPHIVNNGVSWFNGLSRGEDGGTKIYGVSGRVRKPGAWELPMGTTAREILQAHAGGLVDGFKFRGLLPGGASSYFLTEEHLDLKMDFSTLHKAGCRLGTGTIVVLDDRTCPVGFVSNLISFFSRESCGWCTPCREGLPWVAKTLRTIEDGLGEPRDIETLKMHVRHIRLGNTFCALAPGAMEPLESALTHFGEDFEQHVREKRCPWK